MHETTITTRAILTAVLTALSVWLELLAVPVLLLLACMVLDYATGLMAASHRGCAITSYRSINGIAKKVCHLLLVAVGLILDLLVLYMKEALGFNLTWSLVVSAVIAVWLTVNEVISILENIQDITGQLPSWLLPLVKNIQRKVERNTDNDKEDKEQ